MPKRPVIETVLGAANGAALLPLHFYMRYCIFSCRSRRGRMPTQRNSGRQQLEAEKDAWEKLTTVVAQMPRTA
jgi:hypothetical protein